MHWVAWVPMSGSEETIDRKVNNELTYMTKAHVVEDYDVGSGSDSRAGKALCGVRVPAGDSVNWFVHAKSKFDKKGRCKRCAQKFEGWSHSEAVIRHIERGPLMRKFRI